MMMNAKRALLVLVVALLIITGRRALEFDEFLSNNHGKRTT